MEAQKTQPTPEAAELLKSHIKAIREAAGVDTVVIFALKNRDDGVQVCAEIQSPPLDHINLADALERTAKEIKLDIFAKVMQLAKLASDTAAQFRDDHAMEQRWQQLSESVA